MGESVLSWWAWLEAVAVLNIVGWSLSANRADPDGGLERRTMRRLQLALSAGYVFGCAYRSFFPVFDVQRLVLVDSWLSSVLVGRSVATVAELCFAAQWALLLHTLARRADHRPVQSLAAALLPLIVLAECCSWHAVLSTRNLGHVAEESLWALSAGLLAWGLWRLRARLPREWRGLLTLTALLAAGYVAYMVCVDVPMYWARASAELARGHQGLDLAQGVADAGTRWVVSYRWSDWQSETVWMSLYFSFAVWLSIALANAPLKSTRRSR